MIDESGHLVLAAWLATYLVHSTLLLGAAWIITKTLRPGREALMEALWKCALIAPVISATLQVGLQIDPITGGVAVPERAVAVVHPWGAPEILPAANDAAHDPAPALIFEAPAPLPSAPLPHADIHPESARHEDVLVASGGMDLAGAAPGALQRTASFLRQTWPNLLLVAAGLAVLVLAVYAFVVWLRLRAMMRGRRTVTDGPLAQMLETLLARSGSRRRVRLSLSDHLASPIAFGILRPEICLPARVQHDLGAAKQESMLAHELGHILRHDPTWMALAHLLQRLLFFQPLNAIAFHRLRELAEYRCDAWAADIVGDRLALARCLTDVAGWIVQRRSDALLEGVPGMAVGPSTLRCRVTRLLEDRATPRCDFDRRWLAVIAPAVIALATLSAPGVSAKLDERETGASPMETLTSVDEIADPGLPDTTDALVLLRAEMQLLEAELVRLQRTAARGPRDASVESLIDELHRRTRELRARQDDLFAQLSELIDENPDAPPGPRIRTAGIDN